MVRVPDVLPYPHVVIAATVTAIARTIPEINASLSGFGAKSSSRARWRSLCGNVEGNREKVCDPRHTSVE